MQAVILAAGVGKRLQPLTEDVPKPMVMVGDKPILEYTLSILPKVIDEVILVVGYKKEKIIDYFGDSFNGLPIRYIEQTVFNGTAGALDLARPALKGGAFLFLYGDDLYHPKDLEEVAASNEPVVLVKEVANPERFGVCLVDDGGYLLDVLEKPENPPSNLVNPGVYLLNQEIFDVPKVQLANGEYNLSSQIGLWAKERRIKTIKARFWHPIGYPEDVEAAYSLLNLSPEKRLN
ncbi:MAG: sugar phosphate nucleotidyltransferase [bacterium]|nr:sugar phosphate nucleotidyltransferase [bacterium]